MGISTSVPHAGVAVTDTISFETYTDFHGVKRTVSVNMPAVTVMSRRRFKQIWTEHGDVISYDTAHLENPRLTFLLADGYWIYEVYDSGALLLDLTLLQKEIYKP